MQRVSIKNIESSDVLSATSDQQTGRFCIFLPAGNYEFQVALSEREKDDGVQYVAYVFQLLLYKLMSKF